MQILFGYGYLSIYLSIDRDAYATYVVKALKNLGCWLSYLTLRRARLNLRLHEPGPDKSSAKLLSNHDDRTVSIWMKKYQHRGELQVSDFWMVSEFTRSTNQPLAFMKLFYKSAFFPVLAHLAKHCTNKMFSLWVYFSRQAMILQEGNLCYIFSPYSISIYLCLIPG